MSMGNDVVDDLLQGILEYLLGNRSQGGLFGVGHGVDSVAPSSVVVVMSCRLICPAGSADARWWWEIP